MKNPSSYQLLPPLPLDEWELSKNTLHLFMQIVGKIRLYTFPKKNHWWHVPFYLSTHGLTTQPIPYHGRHFELEFDLDQHLLRLEVSNGFNKLIPLSDKSVAGLYEALMSSLSEVGLPVTMKQPYPFDVPFSTVPFAEDHEHATYQPEYVNRFWKILLQVDSIFQEFRGRFLGKSTPPHLFWHHMDFALTRFSGKLAPVKEGAGIVEREAYSHEVVSFGFWAGDKNVRSPAFYAYAAPPPDGLSDLPLKPEEAQWNKDAGMALMMYDAIRESPDPRGKILDFLESTYQTAAGKAGWNLEELLLAT
jgi:hypothetical protein